VVPVVVLDQWREPGADRVGDVVDLPPDLRVEPVDEHEEVDVGLGVTLAARCGAGATEAPQARAEQGADSVSELLDPPTALRAQILPARPRPTSSTASTSS
jgi:hypothetical protein